MVGRQSRSAPPTTDARGGGVEIIQLTNHQAHQIALSGWDARDQPASIHRPFHNNAGTGPCRKTPVARDNQVSQRQKRDNLEMTHT